MSTSERKLSGALVALLDAAEATPGTLSTRVYRAVRSAILDRTLGAGDRLPSTRALAADLAISRATAEAAYAQLEAEGYVSRRVGDGSYVNAPLPPQAPARRRAQPAPSTGIGTGSLSTRGRRIASIGACDDPCAIQAFSAGVPALDSFPFDAWLRLLSRHARQVPDSWSMYGDPQGEPVLREAIAQYLVLSRGVRCDAGQVIVLTSSQQALVAIAMLMLDAGDAAWIEDPGYPGAQSALAAHGARLVPVAVDHEGIDVASAIRMEPDARLAYVTPSHQYPLGTTMSLARRLALLDWARRTGAWIVEDDYDSEFHYDGRPVATIHGLDRHERVLYVGTFSKVMFPGLRIAYLVVPRPLVGAFVTARRQLDGHSPVLMQRVLAEFMRNGQFMAHVRRMRMLYRARRDIFAEESARHLSHFLRPQSSHGGLQMACLLEDQRLSDGHLSSRAAAAGIALPLLSRLYLGAHRQGGFVMGFSALAPAVIRDSIRRLATAWKS